MAIDKGGKLIGFPNELKEDLLQKIKEVLKLAVAVANQYVNDKVVLNGGAA